MRKLVIMAALAVLALGIPAACGNGRQASGSGELLSAGSAGSPEVYQPDRLAAPSGVLAELDALERPEGVDAALWLELKDALAAALTTDNQHLSAGASAKAEPTLRFASTPPTGEGNRVDDLSLTDNGDSTVALEWHYRNLGDYSQDGTVAIADITPLAQHFGEEYDPETEPHCLQAVIDGSGNGKVGIEDITPLAVNFGSQVEGYVVQFAATADATEWTDGEQFPLTLATGDGRLRFQEDIPISGGGFWAVTPYDAANVKGIRGVPVEIPVPAGEWEILTVDDASDVGTDVSLAIVNGNPAVSYYDRTNLDLMYVRATASDGSAWGTPIRVDWTGAAGRCTSLAVVNGNPAISYIESYLQQLKYVRATDADGGAWGEPLVVGDGFQSKTSLQIVAGYPAIAYYHEYHQKFRRATSPDGSTWSASVTADSNDAVGQSSSMRVVNGAPAISYYDGFNQNLKYTRANATGDVWSTVITVDSSNTTANCTALEVVSGAPAIAYVDTSSNLKFVPALDADGLTWDSPITVDGTEITDFYASLAVINGYPAISYNTHTTQLFYVRATSADGSTWGTPVVVDGTNTAAWGNSLAEVNGQPAIVYYDSVNGTLKYARYVP